MGIKCGVGGIAALDVEGPVGSHVDTKLEQLVDAALLVGCGVGEAGSGVGGEVLWLVEVGLVGGGLLPQVELV